MARKMQHLLVQKNGCGASCGLLAGPRQVGRRHAQSFGPFGQVHDARRNLSHLCKQARGQPRCRIRRGRRVVFQRQVSAQPDTEQIAMRLQRLVHQGPFCFRLAQTDFKKACCIANGRDFTQAQKPGGLWQAQQPPGPALAARGPRPVCQGSWKRRQLWREGQQVMRAQPMPGPAQQAQPLPALDQHKRMHIPRMGQRRRAILRPASIAQASRTRWAMSCQASFHTSVYNDFVALHSSEFQRNRAELRLPPTSCQSAICRRNQVRWRLGILARGDAGATQQPPPLHAQLPRPERPSPLSRQSPCRIAGPGHSAFAWHEPPPAPPRASIFCKARLDAWASATSFGASRQKQAAFARPKAPALAVSCCQRCSGRPVDLFDLPGALNPGAIRLIQTSARLRDRCCRKHCATKILRIRLCRANLLRGCRWDIGQAFGQGREV